MKDNQLSSDDLLNAMYYEHTKKRSKHAQQVDEGMNADITNNPYIWMSDMSRHDFLGIDTIGHHKPKHYSENKGRKAYNQVRGKYDL